MRLWSVLQACILPTGIALGVLPACVALAQDQPQYETPKYQPRPPTEVEKTYGLPSFGMPGSELLQQKTMAPVKPPDASVVPDFFASSTEIQVPMAPAAPAGAATSDTPLYTTSDGSTMATASALSDDSDTSSDDTTEARKVSR